MQPHLNRTLEEGERVFVYFNLHKHQFSIKALTGENKGKVVAHADRVYLRDGIFTVNQGGRNRVLRESRKNVHAGVIGTYQKESEGGKLIREVTYNPYLYETFVDKRDRQPIEQADHVLLRDKRVFIQ